VRRVDERAAFAQFKSQRLFCDPFLFRIVVPRSERVGPCFYRVFVTGVARDLEAAFPLVVFDEA
jgi:hypothetical protein